MFHQGTRQELQRARGEGGLEKIARTKDRVLVQYQSSTPHQIRSHIVRLAQNQLYQFSCSRQSTVGSEGNIHLEAQSFNKNPNTLCVREEIKIVGCWTSSASIHHFFIDCQYTTTSSSSSNNVKTIIILLLLDRSTTIITQTKQ